ncbi:hypothetical protein [Bradyrhizobium sp. CB1015]|uniref:hypothetical protein n=1 Tax=Bradyrhizobium sp. CB1015 TaxID=2976822 RepID=UPI0021A9BC84|nr:hypothetical protein [Bradyrhizobium sp. CB1015]UWU95738.1 hypothetical protein N2604_18435 [Bradyrhizobium sp. CB1015]
MPTFTKLKSGSWRVQVRRKNEYVANTFVRRRDAEEWALDVERSIDRGTPIRGSRSHKQPRTFSDLIALHLDDLAQVGKPVRRSKSMVLKALKTSLGRVNLKDMTRERLIEFGRKSEPLKARARPLLQSISRSSERSYSMRPLSTASMSLPRVSNSPELP